MSRAKPELIGVIHPWRNLVFRPFAVVFQLETFPWHVTKWRRIDGAVELLMADKWGNTSSLTSVQ